MALLKVLVVDDEPDIREILVDILSLKDCQVTGAENPSKALELLKTSQFDIIFSDMNMPGMNGLDFFRVCLKNSADTKTKRFLLTGEMSSENLLTPEDKVNGLIHGFVLKPFNDSQLDEALQSLNKS